MVTTGPFITVRYGSCHQGTPSLVSHHSRNRLITIIRKARIWCKKDFQSASQPKGWCPKVHTSLEISQKASSFLQNKNIFFLMTHHFFFCEPCCRERTRSHYLLRAAGQKSSENAVFRLGRQFQYDREPWVQQEGQRRQNIAKTFGGQRHLCCSCGSEIRSLQSRGRSDYVINKHQTTLSFFPFSKDFFVLPGCWLSLFF